MVYTCSGLGFGGGVWNMVFVILFWILVIVAIIWIITKYKGGDSIFNSSPERLLKERYAKGEISKKKYQEMKKELRK